MQTVVFATVVSVDRVILSGDGDTGAVAGAIIGGVAGASVTDSETESDIAGVLGALVGSAVGSKIGDAATRKPAIELLLDLDSGKTVKAVEIIGAINAFPTEKEFKKYFYDQYGENAFGEGEIEVIIKYYNDVKTEEAEAEKEAEKEEGGDGEEGGEDDPLGDI